MEMFCSPRSSITSLYNILWSATVSWMCVYADPLVPQSEGNAKTHSVRSTHKAPGITYSSIHQARATRFFPPELFQLGNLGTLRCDEKRVCGSGGSDWAKVVVDFFPDGAHIFWTNIIMFAEPYYKIVLGPVLMAAVPKETDQPSSGTGKDHGAEPPLGYQDEIREMKLSERKLTSGRNSTRGRRELR